MNSVEKTNSPKNLILYFQVHQPNRLHPVNFFDLAGSPHYFNESLDESIIRRVARDNYLPANKLLLELIQECPRIRIVLSLSGTVIEQMEKYAPEALDSFRQLVQTGAVEILGETYYHSLASLVKTEEFESQVLLHAEKVLEIFGVRPTVFRNTELIYNNDIGNRVAMMGYRGIFTEGHENILGTQTPHKLYCHPDARELRIFLRNYRLSDDIAFRFMEGGVRLQVAKFMKWLEGIPSNEPLVNLAMDYETFGEHHKASTGIFDFLRDFLNVITGSDNYRMILPTEALNIADKVEPLSVEKYLSWADQERDISAWLGNDMQRDAFNSVMKMESELKHLSNTRLLSYWRYLQTSDHFYYMCIKTDMDGSVHSYFSPFASSYEAFINYMNVVTHLNYLISEEKANPEKDNHNLSSSEAERQKVKTSTPVWVMNLEPQGNIPGVHN